MKRLEVTHRMRSILRKRREALLHSLNRDLAGLHGALDQVAVGDLADAAVDAERESISSQLAAVESAELAAIENALQRMEQGQYGCCETCGQAIPMARLQALPYATLCIDCQRQAESKRGLAMEQPPSLGVTGSQQPAPRGQAMAFAGPPL